MVYCMIGGTCCFQANSDTMHDVRPASKICAEGLALLQMHCCVTRPICNLCVLHQVYLAANSSLPLHNLQSFGVLL